MRSVDDPLKLIYRFREILCRILNLHLDIKSCLKQAREGQHPIGKIESSSCMDLGCAFASRSLYGCAAWTMGAG